MSDLPDVTIVMTTYFTDQERITLAEKALRSWENFLCYSAYNYINLHIADDGSTLDWDIVDIWPGGNVSYSHQERKGVGASLNAGFKKAFETSPIVLYAVDDWKLMYDIDITHWVKVLMEREDVGMVRLGPPHPNIRGSVEAFSEHWNTWGYG